MAENKPTRLEQLHRMLEKEPRDPFLLYGAGLEYKKAGEFPKALDYLAKVVAIDPGYCYAYLQQGQVHELAGDIGAAKAAYRAGIAAARSKGDAHAQQEIEAALAVIDG